MRVEMFPNTETTRVTKGSGEISISEPGHVSFADALAHSTHEGTIAAPPTIVGPRSSIPGGDHDSECSEQTRQVAGYSDAASRKPTTGCKESVGAEIRSAPATARQSAGKAGAESDQTASANFGSASGASAKMASGLQTPIGPVSMRIVAGPAEVTNEAQQAKPEPVNQTGNLIVPVLLPIFQPVTSDVSASVGRGTADPGAEMSSSVSASSGATAGVETGGPADLAWSFVPTIFSNSAPAPRNVASNIARNSIEPGAEKTSDVARSTVIQSAGSSKDAFDAPDIVSSVSALSPEIPSIERASLRPTLGDDGITAAAALAESSTGLATGPEASQSPDSSSFTPPSTAATPGSEVISNLSSVVAVSDQIAGVVEAVGNFRSVDMGAASPPLRSSTVFSSMGRQVSEPLSKSSSSIAKFDREGIDAGSLPTQLRISTFDKMKPSAFKPELPPINATKVKSTNALRNDQSPALPLRSSVATGGSTAADEDTSVQTVPSDPAMVSPTTDNPNITGLHASDFVSYPDPNSTAASAPGAPAVADSKEAGGADGTDGKPDPLSGTSSSPVVPGDEKLSSSNSFSIPTPTPVVPRDTASAAGQVVPGSTMDAPMVPEKSSTPSGLPPAQQMLDSAPVPADAAATSPSAHLIPDAAALQMHVGVRTAAFGNVEIHTIVEQSQVGVAIHGDRDLSRWFNSEVGGLAAGLKSQHLNLTAIDFDNGRAGVQTGTSFQQGQPRQNFSQTSNTQPAASPSKVAANESEISCPAEVSKEPLETRVSILA